LARPSRSGSPRQCPATMSVPWSAHCRPLRCPSRRWPACRQSVASGCKRPAWPLACATGYWQPSLPLRRPNSSRDPRSEAATAAGGVVANRPGPVWCPAARSLSIARKGMRWPSTVADAHCRPVMTPVALSTATSAALYRSRRSAGGSTAIPALTPIFARAVLPNALREDRRPAARAPPR
jgi:hypothetical protein